MSALREQERIVFVLDLVYNGWKVKGETGGCATTPSVSNVIPTVNREATCGSSVCFTEPASGIPVVAGDAMSANIIAALRSENQLHGNLKFTAIEVGHRMNTSGYGRVAYQMMAYATGYSRRTAIRHMHKLVRMGIFAKTVYRLANGYAINLYKCLLSPPAFYRRAPATTHGDSVTPTLPTPKTAEAKELSLKEEIRLQRKGLQFLMEGSDRYQACLEKIAALEAREMT